MSLISQYLKMGSSGITLVNRRVLELTINGRHVVNKHQHCLTGAFRYPLPQEIARMLWAGLEQPTGLGS